MKRKRNITLMKKDSEKQEMKQEIFLAASDQNFEALILLALNAAESNNLSSYLLILYINQ